MARLLADENFPLPVVEALRRLEHDVLTLQQAGKANQRFPDEAVLQLATERSRVLLTLNRKHFIHLHRDSSAHAGVIVCTFDPDFAGQAERIHEALTSSDVLSGRLIRVNRPA